MSAAPTFVQALALWARIGCLSFGGPAGQIALMQAELVDRRRWIDGASFVHGLNYCMLLPGPEAMQLACYLGWRLHGVPGGIAAGTLFIVPGALLMLLLAWLFVTIGAHPLAAAVLLGVQAAVLGIVAQALLRLGRRMLTTFYAVLLALVALMALALLALPFPLLIGLAAVAGTFAAARRPHWLPKVGHAAIGGLRAQATPRWPSSVLLALVLLALWWLPILALMGLLGAGSTASTMGLFFSQAALVTFGGAYAVLPYVAQQAVESYAWLAPGQMLVGLGFAESTPGPLILVLQFVGFVGGWQQPDLSSPLLSALLCAGITVWATFLPSFLFVLPAAPWIERVREVPLLAGALAGVSAAVVGVVAHLAVWFGWQLLVNADLAQSILIIGLALASWWALHRQWLPLPAVVILAGLFGVGFAALMPA